MGKNERLLALLKKLEEGEELSRDSFLYLIRHRGDLDLAELGKRAVEIRKKVYGNRVYMRGLIEFSNFCKNNCYYCGIRRENRYADRYRLTGDEILSACSRGYKLGFRTFVLQGGEDPLFHPKRLADIVSAVKETYPDCAVTLSVGEHSRETYRLWREAGADRYLLRHETADEELYRKLHPSELSLENRKRCLEDLKDLGFQAGCGFMVGSPYQTEESLAEDLAFIQGFQPQMVGIGPFIPHHDTPFAKERAGSLEDTLFFLSIIRLMLPNVLLPATTALGTIVPQGRVLGILSGANVVMPNLSPETVRGKYLLYDKKICTGNEAAEGLDSLRKQMKAMGCELAVDRGDYKEIDRGERSL